MKTDTTTIIALTQREIFLMDKAYKAGAWYPGGLSAWIESPVSGSVTVGESLISDAQLATAISDFLARTGQYVTNYASSDAAISAAVAAERSRCISAVNDERVNSVSKEGVAYNLALDHACAAIQSVEKQ